MAESWWPLVTVGVKAARSGRDSSQPKLNPGFCIAGLGLGLFMPDFYSLLWKEDSVGQNESSACWRPGEKTSESMASMWKSIPSVKRLISFSLRLMYHAMTVGGYSSLSVAWEGLSGTWIKIQDLRHTSEEDTPALHSPTGSYQYIKEN